MSETRQSARDFPPEVLRLFDRYVHGLIDRRGFIEGAARFAVAGLTAAGMLESLSPRYAWASQVAPDDTRLRSAYVEFPSAQGSGTMRGYLARPAASGPKPAILVLHENRGLNPYIEDVVRRFALADFVAFGPDALTPLGGYPGNDDEGRAMQSTLDRATILEDFTAAAGWLRSHPESTGRLGAVGFCFGGGAVGSLAVRLHDLHAAVPFYGSAPAPADVPRIRAPLLIHLAGLDERINAGWPACEEALAAAGKTYTVHRYEGVQHGFHNDTTPRFDEPAARLAERRTLDFFNHYLR